MTPLGKPLVFFLKHMAEMNRLYFPESHGGEPDLTGHDAEQVREMARIVGAAACEQVADFLELCAKGIEEHFTGLGIATIAKKRRRSSVLDDWTWWTHVRVPSMRYGWFSCAVFVSAPPETQISLERDACGVVVPYIWSNGGRKGEDAVWKILGGWPHSRGVEGLVQYRGTVALACIPIKSQPPESFDVDREDLITKVMKTIKRIGTKQTKAIANFVAGFKGTDED